jgi:hypothetical protein
MHGYFVTMYCLQGVELPRCVMVVHVLARLLPCVRASPFSFSIAPNDLCAPFHVARQY